EQGAQIRPWPGLRHEARHPGRNRGAVRAGRREGRVARRPRRRSSRVRAQRVDRWPHGGEPKKRQPGARGPLTIPGERIVSLRIPRRQYADLYGPTVGDRVRLADTDLLIEIERDFTTYGDEVKFGGGKVIRDGMGQSARATAGQGVLDLV